MSISFSICRTRPFYIDGKGIIKTRKYMHKIVIIKPLGAFLSDLEIPKIPDSLVELSVTKPLNPS